jgi:hypothetical protein
MLNVVMLSVIIQNALASELTLITKNFVHKTSYNILKIIFKHGCFDYSKTLIKKTLISQPV